MEDIKHDCIRPAKAEEGNYGHSIDVIWEENGKLFADNGEYCTQVNYCPFCGGKAKVQIEENK